MIREVVARLSAPGAAERSILSDPDFQRARTLLVGPQNTISFFDTKHFAKRLHPLFAMGTQAAISYFSAEVPELNASFIPSPAVWADHVLGDIGGIQQREDGLLLTGHGSFPVSIGGAVLAAQVIPWLGVRNVESRRANAGEVIVEPEPEPQPSERKEF